MSASSHQILTPEQAPLVLSPGELHDQDIHQKLLPFQVSAEKATTAVGLYAELKGLLAFDAEGDQPDSLVITSINPQLAAALWHQLETREPRALRLSYSETEQIFQIKMPTPVHNCVCPWLLRVFQEWMQNGSMNTAEIQLLKYSTADTLMLFNGAFATNEKQEPDALIRATGQRYPTVCFEVGWSESQPLLERDMRGLLVGGQDKINVVILIKWTKRTAGVGGKVQVWRLDAAGVPRKDQEETIFPTPTATQSPLLLTRQEVFGAALLPERNPADLFPFSLDDLRAEAADALMTLQNLTPL